MNKIIMTLAAALSMASCGKMQAQKEYKTVNNSEFEQCIAQTDSVTLLDVRTDEEYVEGHINNAAHIDVLQSDFLSKATHALPKSRTIAVYCRSGKRSAAAAAKLTAEGYKVVNLDNGVMGWQASGRALVTKDTPTPDSNGYIVYEGQACPDFTVTLTNGKSVKLSDLKGKVVMLQFTASWCGVCREEMPHIERDIWQKHKDNPDFVLIGIDRDEPIDKVQHFAKSTGITYPLALDPSAKVYEKFALPQSGITRNVLIDKNGIIIHRTRLYNPAEFAALVQHIDTVLKP